ncbi:RloB family protein [Geitlerinema sp. CS-897]|nr:RloB family protein [Geitlerinema sp. CS-897]
MAKKSKRSFSRPKPSRDLRKVYFIATEGEKTEAIYFDCFKGNPYRQNVIVRVLPTRKGRSSPTSVLNRLQEKIKKTQLKPGDELWLIVDVPEWEKSELQQVYQVCQKQGYFLGASNPSFELWLLLHQRNPRTPATVKECESELTRLLGKRYEKSNYDAQKLLAYVKEAIAHGKRLHTDEQEFCPQQVGTHVYRLVEKLIVKT